MKFTLICEHDSGPKVTYEFQNILLADTLDNFQNFLKGCGFVFDGILEIVEEGEPMAHNYIVDDEFDGDGRC